ncbi:hypothetical protein Sgly_2292 [Syntrophobotulus glycolicus DSM 8271]|uniref:Uncharacterized protein n=1 Tax=Syntrophobotulus glycolicus (strain DSM 8271 / FlGlyR) TaxID=645991 RepID=F0SUD1_SYNGF|nr:hypothetical protein [Syntrophobotulus glycolicus]ADY56581.1 hypothetical protein Sgly_2292 [Syntrophobotulus glycolicus DSM 8271]
MRKLIISLLLILIFHLIGCTPKTNETVTPPEEEANLPGDDETNLVFVKKTGEVWLAVDERGIIHQVDSSEVDPSTQAGCSARGKVTIEPSGEILLNVDPGHEMSYVQLVTASYDDAPDTYAKLILDNFLYSSNPDYAVSEYAFKNVEVKKAYHSGRIDAAMTFDVKPSQGAYWWGQVESDGFIRNRRINFTIYGAEGTWLSKDVIMQYFSPSLAPIAVPETQYRPTENQNVIYEDHLYSYYGDKIFQPPRSKEIQEEKIKEYLGTINRINRQSGKTEILYQGDRNYSYRLFCKYNEKLYLLSDTWEPFSEGHPGDFGVLDLETKKYRTLVEGGVIRAAIDKEKGYLFANDKLIRVNLETTKIDPICSLNFYPSYAYDDLRVNRIRDGKLYFGVFGLTLKQYVIDLASGDIKEIV